MTKRQFLELVKKYDEGKCSPQEEAQLIAYCEKVQVKQRLKINSTLGESEKNKVRVNLLKRIDKSIDQIDSKNRSSWLKWGYAAALFLVLATAVFLVRQYSQPTLSDFSNQITLKMGTEDLLVLNNSDEKQLIEVNGELIASVEDGVLVYENKSLPIETHQLNVPYGKTFQVKLSEGSQVHLNAGTSFSYQTSYLPSPNRLVSVNGEAFLEVSKNADQPFVVQANGFKVRVLGTAFNINTYQENEVDEVVLIEGEVGLYTETSFSLDKSTILKPGFKATFNKDSLLFSTEPTVTAPYTAWTNGELIIRNMAFSGLLKILERRFNIEIENTNAELNGELISANFGQNSSLEQVMNDLAVLYEISFEINENQITIQ